MAVKGSAQFTAFAHLLPPPTFCESARISKMSSYCKHLLSDINGTARRGAACSLWRVNYDTVSCSSRIDVWEYNRLPNIISCCGVTLASAATSADGCTAADVQKKKKESLDRERKYCVRRDIPRVARCSRFVRAHLMRLRSALHAHTWARLEDM